MKKFLLLLILQNNLYAEAATTTLPTNIIEEDEEYEEYEEETSVATNIIKAETPGAKKSMKDWLLSFDSLDAWNVKKALDDTNSGSFKRVVSGLIVVGLALYSFNSHIVLQDMIEQHQDTNADAMIRQYAKSQLIRQKSQYSIAGMISAFLTSYIIGIVLYHFSLKTLGVLLKYVAVANVVVKMNIMIRGAHKLIPDFSTSESD